MSTQNVNVARFARNVRWDFFCDFQTLCKGTVNYVALNAYITQSSVNTERYDNLTRGCNFANERQLKYYKNYTRANCELEAKIDGFKENCGCKPYYFPGDLTICDRAGMQCVHRNQSKFERNTSRK